MTAVAHSMTYASDNHGGIEDDPTLHLVLKQIVKALLAVVLGILGRTDTTRPFDHVPHLKEITEVGLFLVHDIGFDRFLALESSPRYPVTAATTAFQVSQTMFTAIGPPYPSLDPGGTATVPAHKSFSRHIAFPIFGEHNITNKVCLATIECDRAPE